MQEFIEIGQYNEYCQYVGLGLLGLTSGLNQTTKPDYKCINLASQLLAHGLQLWEKYTLGYSIIKK